jgi:hypothetical protein
MALLPFYSRFLKQVTPMHFYQVQKYFMHIAVKKTHVEYDGEIWSILLVQQFRNLLNISFR